MKSIGRIFAEILWNSRLLVIVAVIASLIGAVVMLFIATADSVFLTIGIRGYLDPNLTEAARHHLHLVTLGRVAEVVDGYLFAAIMIIFALGLYELFIGKIDVAENSDLGSRLLLIRSVDDLKERLAKVIFLVLIVRYFEFALEAPVNGSVDLLYLAVGIALVAVSLYLTRTVGEKH
ncbi:MAG: YqhA family protein [Candidatus Eremiobacteraeota bacterium]|nr:YqhA family protein [Candidatus Eremiobacteraeota bacterium]